MSNSNRAEAFLAEMSRVYAADGTPDLMVKRLASWLGNADQTCCLFLIVLELRALRADLAATRNDSGVGR